MKRSTGKVLISAFQIAGVAASLGVAGCATSKSDAFATKTNLDMHPIKVHQDVARLEIGVQPGDAGLKPQDISALEAFAADYRDRGRGAMVMSLPAGATNSDAATLIGDDIRRNLYGLLPSADKVATGTYDSKGAVAPIVLSFERYVADIKDCPSAGQANLAQSWDNKPSPGFGCAINSNIAMMLVDPGDVVSPPASTPSDAGRRSAVFDKYREGKPTGTERSKDDRGVISTAVGE
ncbi:MAG: CpaD family pilus assembly protein [Caulobacterales bacterium]